jgi:transcriptional regulator with PAS, ATPase and Fis domain
VGRGVAMLEVLRAVERVASAPSTVLLSGESGTGKELVARAIHRASPRVREAFLTENCAALSETLIESELFGHVRGAFTGAIEGRAGIFQLAHGGTLLLDEIGDMSLPMQGKLLRVLQEGEIRPVGGRDTVRVDVRIVSATHRDLRAMVDRGAFREDLYYRLNVFQIRLPPLRERRDDIGALVEHLLADVASSHGADGVWKVSPGAMEILERYSWPGNIRELRNVVERAMLLSEGGVIRVGDLPEGIVQLSLAEPAVEYGASQNAERRMIEEALLRSGGNKARAAAWIGWNRPKLYRRMRKLGVARDCGAGAMKEGGRTPSPPQGR